MRQAAEPPTRAPQPPPAKKRASFMLTSVADGADTDLSKSRPHNRKSGLGLTSARAGLVHPSGVHNKESSGVGAGGSARGPCRRCRARNRASTAAIR